MKTECIDVDMLYRYITGGLSGQEKKETEKHILECDNCLDDYLLAKNLARDAELPEYDEPLPKYEVQAFFQKIKEKIKDFFKWVPDLQPPDWILNYALSPVRSETRSGTGSSAGSVFMKKEMDDLVMEIYAEKRKDETARICLRVLKENRVAEKSRVTLIRDNGSPSSRFLRSDYEVFDKKPFGNYRLIIIHKKQEKGNYLFKIDEQGIHEQYNIS